MGVSHISNVLGRARTNVTERSSSLTENGGGGAGQAEHSMKEPENNAVKVTDNNLDDGLENGSQTDNGESNFHAV